jgi:hypothetical protein
MLIATFNDCADGLIFARSYWAAVRGRVSCFLALVRESVRGIGCFLAIRLRKCLISKDGGWGGIRTLEKNVALGDYTISFI